MKTAFFLLTVCTSLFVGFTDRFITKTKPGDITADLYAKIDIVELQQDGVKQVVYNIEKQNALDNWEARFLKLQSEMLLEGYSTGSGNSIGENTLLPGMENFLGTTCNFKTQTRIFNNKSLKQYGTAKKL